MPHGKLVRNPVTGWTDGSTITTDEVKALVAGLAGAVNGDDGSTHAPPVQLEIDGAGMPVTGPVVIARGGVLQTSSDIALLGLSSISNADGDLPMLSTINPYRSITRMISLATARGENAYTWNVRREDGGLQAFSPMYDQGDGLGMRVSRAYAGLRPYDGATLTNLSIYFHVGWPHTDLPTTMPSVRVMRIDAFGQATPLTSTVAGADADGYVYAPRPSTPAAWWDRSGQKLLNIPCDQNNVIDAANYDYVVELVEEQGLSGYPWQLTYTIPALVGTSAPITRSGLQTIGGVALQAGSTVLVKNQADPKENGLFIVASGAWPRWDILGTSDQFKQGLVVPVVTDRSYWQVQTSITSWTPDKTSLTFLPPVDWPLPLEGTGFFGHGILWQSMQATYTGITDLRPQ